MSKAARKKKRGKAVKKKMNLQRNPLGTPQPKFKKSISISVVTDTTRFLAAGGTLATVVQKDKMAKALRYSVKDDYLDNFVMVDKVVRLTRSEDKKTTLIHLADGTVVESTDHISDLSSQIKGQ